MGIMKIIIFLSAILFGNTVELPIGLTDEELENIDIIQTMSRETDPPSPPVRNIAEFERMSGVLIRYPFGITTSVIREMAEDLIVYCLVSSNSQNSAYNSMNSAGVDMDNVEFVLGSTDSYWTRDYGPWWVVDGNRDVSVVDFTYNRPRPNDNDAPSKMANHLNTPYFATDIVAAGGNYMTDGLGIGASSSLIYEENSMSNNQIHQDMLDYYGIHTYHAIDDPNNTYIDHIDCWGKFLSPQKVLLREVPSSHAQYDEIEEVVDYFESIPNGYGEPWEIYRVYTPSNQPYTNSIILNNKALVPITNSSWDDDALAAYQDALPGYEILGFTGSWESTDALHCRAKGIPDLEMLQIFHNPIDDQTDPQNFYTVEAIIDDLSEEGLIEDESKVFWWTDEMDESLEILMNVCPQDIEDCYLANIPAQTLDGEVKYYIQAIDLTGRVETLPMAGYYSFNVIGGTPVESGDVNMDGQINVLDIVSVVNYVLGLGNLTDYQSQLADMNSDGTVNILDIISLVNLIIGN
jgi:agmatine/peptidylarginine deiminase